MSSSRQSPKLLDRVRRTCRRQQFSLHTERAYVRWIIRYVRFHDTTHPRHLDEADVRAFLTHLATDRNVAASTQNQALNALTFLYDRVLKSPLGDIGTIERADGSRTLPTVLTREDVKALFDAFGPGPNRLFAHLLYGSGLRLSEALRLRVKDLRVHDGKDGKDRATVLPTRLQEPLQYHLRQVKAQFEQDRTNEVGGVYLPDAQPKSTRAPHRVAMAVRRSLNATLRRPAERHRPPPSPFGLRRPAGRQTGRRRRRH